MRLSIRELSSRLFGHGERKLGHPQLLGAGRKTFEPNQFAHIAFGFMNDIPLISGPASQKNLESLTTNTIKFANQAANLGITTYWIKYAGHEAAAEDLQINIPVSHPHHKIIVIDGDFSDFQSFLITGDQYDPFGNDALRTAIKEQGAHQMFVSSTHAGLLGQTAITSVGEHLGNDYTARLLGGCNMNNNQATATSETLHFHDLLHALQSMSAGNSKRTIAEKYPELQIANP